jgi:transcription elongation GreA/GreB family factor
MTFKQKVHQHYFQLLQDKIDVFQDRIEALTIDAANDAKGSAGDKHETALSMMHLEQEKMNAKINEFLGQKNILESLNPTIKHIVVGVGSLVAANDILLYLSTALPKALIDDKTVFAISPQSPLGQALMGKSLLDAVYVNEKKYSILSLD